MTSIYVESNIRSEMQGRVKRQEDRFYSIERDLFRSKESIFFLILQMMSYNHCSIADQLELVLPYLTSNDLQSISEERSNNDLCTMPGCLNPPQPTIQRKKVASPYSLYCSQECEDKYQALRTQVENNLITYGQISCSEYLTLQGLGHSGINKHLDKMNSLCESLEEARNLDNMTQVDENEDIPEKTQPPAQKKEVQFNEVIESNEGELGVLKESNKELLEENQKELRSFLFTRIYMHMSKIVTKETKEIFKNKVINGFKYDLVHKQLSPLKHSVLQEMVDFVENQFNKNRIELDPIQIENELGILVDTLDFSKCKSGQPGDLDYMTVAFLKMLKYDVSIILKFEEKFAKWKDEHEALVSCFQF